MTTTIDPPAATTQVKNAAAYIDALLLPPNPGGSKSLGLRRAVAQVAQAGEESASVDAGSVIAFTANISGQAKDDVEMSTLLAQLAADAVADRFDDTKGWYKKYLEVLGSIGWVAQAFDFNEFNTSSATLKMDEVALKLMGAIMSGNQLAAVKASLDAMNSLKDDDGRLVLFDTETSRLGKGNFQLGLADETKGSVAMATGAFYFSTPQHQTKFLWFSFKSSELDLWTGTQTMTLNDTIYGGVRAKIITKLGDYRDQYVDDLPLKKKSS